MLLNRVEKALMNNPVRAGIQRYIEAHQLEKMGGRMPGGAALEIGCGRGVGIEIILDVFNAQNVDAFDLDPQMVSLARQKLSASADLIHLWAGDVAKIPVEDNKYDAVFDFAILHHVPNWRDGLKEVHRVLKPRGRFYAEEVLEKFITHPVWKRVLDHPQEDRFDHDCFVEALEKCAFEIISTKRLGKQFGWFVADKRNVEIHHANFESLK